MTTKTDLKKLTAWMRRRFMPECAEEWDSTIHVFLEEGGEFTADVSDGRLHVRRGILNQPLSTIHTDADTLLSVLKGTEPLDLAIMKDTLSADNMVEVFKFVTVFKPVRRHRKPASD